MHEHVPHAGCSPASQTRSKALTTCIGEMSEQGGYVIASWANRVAMRLTPRALLRMHRSKRQSGISAVLAHGSEIARHMQIAHPCKAVIAIVDTGMELLPQCHQKLAGVTTVGKVDHGTGADI